MDAYEKKLNERTAKAWIRRFARRDAGFILLLCVVSAAVSGSAVLFALLSRQVVDIATGDIEGNLLFFSGLLMLVLVAQIALDALSSFLNNWISGRMTIRIRDGMFATLFCKQWKDVSAYHSGDLLNRLTGDCDVVVSGVVQLLPKTVSLVTRLIACLVVLLLMDWRFTLVMMLIGGVMLIAGRLYGRKMKKLHKQCQEADGRSRSMMQESLENWTVIQSFDGSRHMRGKLKERMTEHFRLIIRRTHWSNVSGSALHLLFSGSYYVALAWGAMRLSLGAISYGTLTAFLQIVSQIRQPFLNMSGILPRYYAMLASAERLIELENLPDEPRAPMPTAVEYASLDCLRASELTFSYDEEHPVLTDAAITIRKGEFIALTGFSGIGKSTLFKLMLGFYPPLSGELVAVTADGNVPLGVDTRGLFAYVPQQNMLLSGTIRENIAFCREEATEEELWTAAEVAAVADVIRALPLGMDTPLGERGNGLSEGQIQRLAIARAVLSGAPILLLDEATSSLDTATEEQVLKNLRRLPNVTCLCVSHRPAALAVCDRVVRVENGTFVDVK